MATYKHDSVTPFKQEKSSKKEQVAKMFDGIAFKYDFLNRFLSVGIDIRWRKKAIRQLKEINPQKILDVATGTADLALMAYKMLQPKSIIGIDISEGMLEKGRRKIMEANLQSVIELQQGDSEAINFPDASFDAVMVAFGVRNFSDLEKGLTEMHRVLKPNGKLVILECSEPETPIIKNFYHLYTHIIVPKAGQWFANNKEAYQYLNNSVEAFPKGEDFLNIMKKIGFNEVYRKPLSLGICTIYCGKK